MRSPFLYNNSPELYLDNNATIEFQIPFNIGGVLISLKNESYKPVWITSDLLRISGTQEFLERKTINNIEFLISNSIIPNYSLKDFKRSLRQTYINNQTVFGYFSEKTSTAEYDDQINLKYRPVFIPLFRKTKKISYIFFYLEEYLSQNQTFQINNLKRIIAKEEKKVDGLFHLYNKSILEINNKLEIEKYNNESLKLFPEIKKTKKKLFLDLWNSKNKKKIVWALESSKPSLDNEIILFEEVNKSIQKLKLKILNLNTDSTSEMNFLILMENLNEEQEIHKELTKKSIFLQTINEISNEIEINKSEFIERSIKNLLVFFDLKEMIFIPFEKKDRDLSIEILSQNKRIALSEEEYYVLRQTFQSISRRSIKRVSLNELKNMVNLDSELFTESINLFGIPLYHGDSQYGTIVYSSEREKIELDENYLLYSLSIMIFKYYSNHQIISNYESDLLSLNALKE